MPRTTFSDHALVILSISNLKILENMLLDNDFALQIAELWSQKDVVQESMAMWVTNGL